MATACCCLGGLSFERSLRKGDIPSALAALEEDLPSRARQTFGKGNNLLHIVASSGHVPLLDALLSRLADELHSEDLDPHLDVDQRQQPPPTTIGGGVSGGVREGSTRGGEALHRRSNPLMQRISEGLLGRPPEPPQLTLPRLLNAHNWLGHTPIMRAAQRGHVGVVRALLAAGASPWARDRGLCSSLHHAALRGHGEVITAILQHPASARQPRGTRNLVFRLVDLPTHAGYAPLHFAAAAAQPRALAALLQGGANVAARSWHEGDGWITCPRGSTALHLCARRGDNDMCTAILRHYLVVLRDSGAVDPRLHADVSSMRPWQLAAERGFAALAEILLPTTPLAAVFQGPDEARLHTVPPLRAMASAALQVHLLSQIDQAEAASTAKRQHSARASVFAALRSNTTAVGASGYGGGSMYGIGIDGTSMYGITEGGGVPAALSRTGSLASMVGSALGSLRRQSLRSVHSMKRKLARASRTSHGGGGLADPRKSRGSGEGKNQARGPASPQPVGAAAWIPPPAVPPSSVAGTSMYDRPSAVSLQSASQYGVASHYGGSVAAYGPGGASMYGNEPSGYGIAYGTEASGYGIEPSGYGACIGGSPRTSGAHALAGRSSAILDGGGGGWGDAGGGGVGGGSTVAGLGAQGGALSAGYIAWHPAGDGVLPGGEPLLPPRPQGSRHNPLQSEVQGGSPATSGSSPAAGGSPVPGGSPVLGTYTPTHASGAPWTALPPLGGLPRPPLPPAPWSMAPPPTALGAPASPSPGLPLGTPFALPGGQLADLALATPAPPNAAQVPARPSLVGGSPVARGPVGVGPTASGAEGSRGLAASDSPLPAHRLFPQPPQPQLKPVSEEAVSSVAGLGEAACAEAAAVQAASPSGVGAPPSGTSRRRPGGSVPASPGLRPAGGSVEAPATTAAQQGLGSGSMLSGRNGRGASGGPSVGPGVSGSGPRGAANDSNAGQAPQAERVAGAGCGSTAAQQIGSDVSENLCGICFERAAILSLRPCDHVLCAQCSRELTRMVAGHPPTCPFCRGVVRGFGC